MGFGTGLPGAYVQVFYLFEEFQAAIDKKLGCGVGVYVEDLGFSWF